MHFKKSSKNKIWKTLHAGSWREDADRKNLQFQAKVLPKH